MKCRSDYVLIIPSMVGKVCMVVGGVTIAKKLAKPVIGRVIGYPIVIKCAIDAKIHSNSREEYLEKFIENVENATKRLGKMAEDIKSKNE